MTENEAMQAYHGIKYDYLRLKDANAAREALQELFTVCFEAYKFSASFGRVLERAYSLLRRIENSSAANPPSAYRYDVVFTVEDLIFCADIITAQTKKCFSFDCDFECAYISLDIKSFSLAFLELLSNAVSYSTGSEIRVKLSLFDGFVGISVSNSGFFCAEKFQKAVCSDGSLGFINRMLNKAGGSLVMTNGEDTTTLALKIPTADDSLPCTLPFAVDDLLYDRLSVLYIAFFGHGLTNTQNATII